ncbi:MAG: hypothetical protein ACRDK2_00755, partial [Solirubrobacteraceae bacterium]
PNREKAVVQSTRLTVVALMLATVGLLLIITIGGSSVMQAASMAVQGAYILIFLTLAYYAARWNRGVLPVVASLAVILSIFSLVAGPFWFDRDKFGFAQPTLNAGLLGTLTFVIIPVQVLLITFAMRGFSQGWNVEVEHATRGGEDLAAYPA